MPYVSREDLENALGAELVRSIYDDDQDGSPQEGAVIACCAWASSAVDTFFRSLQEEIVLPLVTVPDEVRFIALEFAIAYTMRRRPELATTLGSKSWTDYRDSAVEQMKRYLDGLQTLSTTSLTNDAGVPDVFSDERRGEIGGTTDSFYASGD